MKLETTQDKGSKNTFPTVGNKLPLIKLQEVVTPPARPTLIQTRQRYDISPILGVKGLLNYLNHFPHLALPLAACCTVTVLH